MPRHAKAVPIYRDRTGNFYADLRRYRDVGGKRQALHTGIRKDAEEKCKELVTEFEALQLNQRQEIPGDDVKLGESIEAFLQWKKEHSDVRARTIEDDRKALEQAQECFGAERTLKSIRPTPDIEQYLTHLKQTIRPMRGVVSGSTLRNKLKSLSGLYAWAGYRDFVQHNPVRALAGPVKPKARFAEATFLQPADVALVLEAARFIPSGEMPHQRAVIATLALTGGRRNEVLGLTWDDVNFKNKTVTFRPNDFRKLKTAKSSRVVPLHPQLEVILDEWLINRMVNEGIDYPAPIAMNLVFPSYHSRVMGKKEEQMIGDLRTMWDRINAGLEWVPKHPLDPERISSKAFRNSYAAARLQTLDAGHSIQMYTVARELGHASLNMLTHIYGHVGKVKERKEVVEFRIEDYPEQQEKLDAIRERLKAPGPMEPFTLHGKGRTT